MFIVVLLTLVSFSSTFVYFYLMMLTIGFIMTFTI